MKLSIVVLIITLLTFSVLAQSSNDDCSCDVSLRKDLISIKRNERQQYAFLSLITKDEFEEYKRGLSVSGGQTVLTNVPLAKNIIDISADWNDFNQKRQSYLNQVNYNSSTENQFEELRVITEPIAYRYWSECKKTCALTRTGFHGWIVKENKDVVVVAVKFNAPPNSPRLLATSELIGGKVRGASANKVFRSGTKFGSNEEKTVFIRRILNQPTITANMSVEGYSGVTIESEWRSASDPVLAEPRTPSTSAAQPPSAELSTSTTRIVWGKSATLNWKTSYATHINVDPLGPVGAEDSREVSPQATTIYRLVASGPGGPPATKEITVEVVPKMTLYQDINYGGAAHSVNTTEVRLPGFEKIASSMIIHTDEWVLCLSNDISLTMLYIKGPRELKNLHHIHRAVGNPHAWGDVIAGCMIGGPPSPDNRNDNRVTIIE